MVPWLFVTQRSRCKANARWSWLATEAPGSILFEQERLLLEEDNLFHIILLWWELIMPTSRKIKRVLTESYYFEILGLRFWKVLISTFSWGQSVLSKFKSKKRTRPSKNSVSFLFLINGDWLTWRIRTDNFGLLGKLINHILIPHWLLKNKPDYLVKTALVISQVPHAASQQLDL